MHMPYAALPAMRLESGYDDSNLGMRLKRRRTAVLWAGAVITSLVFSAVDLGHAPPARADSSIGGLQQQINQDQNLLNSIAAQLAQNSASIATLQNEIVQARAVLQQLTTQLATTSATLATDRARLDQLVQQENTVEGELAANQAKLTAQEALLAAHVRTLDKVERMPIFEILLTSHNFSDFLSRVMVVKEILSSDYSLANQLKATKARISSELAQLDAARQEQANVVAQVNAQAQLLASETAQQNLALANISTAESRLQAANASLAAQRTNVSAQLAADTAQLQALEAFAQGRVGSGGAVIAPEVLSDSWGTYYNQRDARWGNDYVGGSSYQVWEIGCLLTDIAMVATHYGVAINPGEIAMNPSYFTSGGLMYNSAFSIPGHLVGIYSNPSNAFISSQLASGGVVIVGMYISGGTHFVTLRANRGAYDYWMNDPWNPWAMDVSFDASSVTGPIFEAIVYH